MIGIHTSIVDPNQETVFPVSTQNSLSSVVPTLTGAVVGILAGTEACLVGHCIGHCIGTGFKRLGLPGSATQLTGAMAANALLVHALGATPFYIGMRITAIVSSIYFFAVEGANHGVIEMVNRRAVEGVNRGVLYGEGRDRILHSRRKGCRLGCLTALATSFAFNPVVGMAAGALTAYTISRFGTSQG